MQATNLLNQRIRIVGKANTDIAEWLQVRDEEDSATITQPAHICCTGEAARRRHIRFELAEAREKRVPRCGLRARV